jgi:hypothetical protein
MLITCYANFTVGSPWDADQRRHTDVDVTFRAAG